MSDSRRLPSVSAAPPVTQRVSSEASNFIWKKFSYHGGRDRLVAGKLYLVSFLITGLLLRWLQDKNATVLDKVCFYLGMVFFVGLSGVIAHKAASVNAASRVFLEKLQVMLKDPELQEAVRKVLDRSITYPASKIVTLDCTLPEQDRVDLAFVLEHMTNWNRGSEQFVQMLTPCVHAQYVNPALMRLWFDTGVSPEQQLLRQMEEWQVDRLLHKGGFNYLTWCVESVKLNLIKFLPLLMEMEDAIHFERADLEDVLRHIDAAYQSDLEVFNFDESIKVPLANFSAAFLAVVKKHLAHDWRQTSAKFFTGAFGWELFARLYSLACGQSYSFGSSGFDNGFKPGYWLVTGIGAALALNIGILGSQYVLSKFCKGIEVSRYHTLCLQLLFSVTIVDGLWQPIADISALYQKLLCDIDPSLYFVSMMITWGLYLVPSFLFKALHNWSNVVHVEDSGQKKFICSDEFVAWLALLYTSFLYSPEYFYSCTGLDFTGPTLIAIFLDCLVAGAGAVWPVMIAMTIQNHVVLKKFQQGLDDVVEDHPDIVEHSLPQTEGEGLDESLLAGRARGQLSPLIRCGRWVEGVACKATEAYVGAVRAAGNCFPS